MCYKSNNNKEPPSTFKSEAKKRIKQSLSKRPELESFLEENHAKGRFIRACTNNVFGIGTGFNVCSITEICRTIETKDNPVLDCFSWSINTEGWSYWNKLYVKFKEK